MTHGDRVGTDPYISVIIHIFYTEINAIRFENLKDFFDNTDLGNIV